MHSAFRGCRGRRGVQSSELQTSLVFSVFWFFLHLWWWLSDFLQGCQHELKQIFVRVCVCVYKRGIYIGYYCNWSARISSTAKPKSKRCLLPQTHEIWHMTERALSVFSFFFFVCSMRKCHAIHFAVGCSAYNDFSQRSRFSFHIFFVAYN